MLTMLHTVLENLQVMAPQAIAILLLILALVPGFLLGACVFLWVNGWRPMKKPNVELSGNQQRTQNDE